MRSLLASNSPHQLAAGCTLGMMIGLVPKGNLIVLVLCVLVFSLRVNKGMALVAAIVFAVLGPYADAFSHKLGLAVLSIDLFQPVYASVLCLPLGPWLGFHNTVVAGTLLMGLYVAYPVYWAVRAISTWWQRVPWAGRRREETHEAATYSHKDLLAAEGTA
jgi:uncharacterized protein (TIGR03546 family)